MTLPCGCIPNVSPCADAQALCEAVADAHHALTLARRAQDAQRVLYVGKRHTAKEREHNDALSLAAGEAMGDYVNAMDAYVEHNAAEAVVVETAPLFTPGAVMPAKRPGGSM